MIFTVGHAPGYYQRIEEKLLKGERLYKLGARDDYPGGYALRTRADAERLIEELEKRDWAVFGLEAEWGVDTRPNEDGWWHNLQRDAVIVDLRPSLIVNGRVFRGERQDAISYGAAVALAGCVGRTDLIVEFSNGPDAAEGVLHVGETTNVCDGMTFRVYQRPK